MLAVDSQSWMQIPYPGAAGVPVVASNSHLPPPPPMTGNTTPISSSAMHHQVDMKPYIGDSLSLGGGMTQLSPPMIQSQNQHNVSSVTNKQAQEARVKRPMNAFMVS